MFPSWGGYGAGHQYMGTRPPSHLSSLREQHLQQMQQLQQLHQKQLQSVLHHGPGGGPAWLPQPPAPAPGSGSSLQEQQQQPRPPQPPAPPQQQQQQQQQQAQRAAPEAAGKPEPNEPPASPAHKPDLSAMTLQEQQQYWYKQHLQNLQKLKNEKAKQNQNGESLKPPADSTDPPPPVEPPKNAPPPPPPQESPPPLPPVSKSGVVTPPEDPVEAARLQQLKAAAAQWQQTQQQRVTYQYQALMQQHSQLQKVLQQYQQVIQPPTHLQTMPMDMQLRHYEMQQQQFTPLYQEWNQHFRLWQEQFQTYPHKDQLQDYESQWKQWQEQMLSTATHLQERVTTLRAFPQQYGSSPYMNLMGVGQYGHARIPPPPIITTPVPAASQIDSDPSQRSVLKTPQPPLSTDIGSKLTKQTVLETRPAVSSESGPPLGQASVRMPLPASVSPTSKDDLDSSQRTVLNTSQMPLSEGVRSQTAHQTVSESHPPASSASSGPRPLTGPGPPPNRGATPTPVPPPTAYFASGPSVHPVRPAVPPLGPRGLRFEGSRGSCPPRYELQQQGVSPRQPFEQPPRGNVPPCFGVPGRFEPPPRQGPPCYERQHGPPPISAQNPPNVDIKSQQIDKPKVESQPQAQHVQAETKTNEEPKRDMNLEVLTDDIIDSNNGFFVQSEPIPQTTGKSDVLKISEVTNKEETKEKANVDISKTSESSPSPCATKQPQTTSDAGSVKHGGTEVKNTASLDQMSKTTAKSDASKLLQGDSQTGPPPLGRGRGRGIPIPFRGRGRGRGMPLGSSHGFGGTTVHHEDDVDSMQYGYQEESSDWRDVPREMPPRSLRPPPDKEWNGEEEGDYQEAYYDEKPPHEDLWEENVAESWENHNWMGWRPPLRHRLPFPQGHRWPPPPRGFLPHGPRRPFHLRGAMDNGPRGPPMHHDSVGPPVRHKMMERDGTQLPLPPREILERERRPPPAFHHDPEPGWPHPPHNRELRRPIPPHELVEQDRRWMQPRRPPPLHEAVDEDQGYHDNYSNDYGPNDEYHPPRDCESQEYDSEESRFPPWERGHRGRGYHPRPPYPPRGPPEHFRKGSWPEEHDPTYSFEAEPRDWGELRVREYPEPSYQREGAPYPPTPVTQDWERPMQERKFPPDSEEQRSLFEAHPEQQGELPAPVVIPGQTSILPEVSVEQASPGTGKSMLALSERQHEIILKAAQELKMMRERQENKTSMGEFLKPEASAEAQPEGLPEGLMGLEIPPEVRTALQAASLLPESQQIPAAAPPVWESTPVTIQPQAAITKPTVISRTVDYGHGHDVSSTVERISYGERIVLRPDPLPSERQYEKEHLGPRDLYDRDPYYERHGDPYLDRRDYGRERELYRDKPPMDYERERYERERFARDDRLPPGPLSRPGGYRERELRNSGEREREDHYGRPMFERPLYERPPERPAFDHIPPPYGGERRSYPDERLPVPPSALPPPPAAPRMEKKPETKNVDDILKPPGRASRPERIVVIMRGLPGSGKTHVAKLIRDKEVEFGGAPPRVLGLDDYFMTEVEKIEKDPDTGKRVKRKVLEYEYEPEMEDTYRSSMLKTFRKTLDDGFFPFIIIDAINDKVKHFDQFWSAAKTKGFEVYLAEMSADNQICAKRNVHGRKIKDITKIAGSWEQTPRHMVRLDIRSLLQDAAIEEVEMEDFNPAEEEQKAETSAPVTEEEEGDLGYIPKSKWEMDTSEAKLDKLDGLSSSSKRKRDFSHMSGMEDFLQLPDDYASRSSEPGKKRVRWADLEEQKDADRKRAIGFIVGQTDWEKITDESGQLAQRALNRTKYF